MSNAWSQVRISSNNNGNIGRLLYILQNRRDISGIHTMASEERGLGAGQAHPGYGSVPAIPAGSLPGRARKTQVAWLAGAAVCAAVVGLTLIAVSWSGDEKSVLLQKAVHKTALDEAATVLPPTVEDFASFKEGASPVCSPPLSFPPAGGSFLTWFPFGLQVQMRS